MTLFLYFYKNSYKKQKNKSLISLCLLTSNFYYLFEPPLPVSLRQDAFEQTTMDACTTG